jgi:hypothetical protein
VVSIVHSNVFCESGVESADDESEDDEVEDVSTSIGRSSTEGCGGVT